MCLHATAQYSNTQHKQKKKAHRHKVQLSTRMHIWLWCHQHVLQLLTQNQQQLHVCSRHRVSVSLPASSCSALSGTTTRSPSSHTLRRPDSFTGTVLKHSCHSCRRLAPHKLKLEAPGCGRSSGSCACSRPCCCCFRPCACSCSCFCSCCCCPCCSACESVREGAAVAASTAAAAARLAAAASTAAAAVDCVGHIRYASTYGPPCMHTYQSNTRRHHLKFIDNPWCTKAIGVLTSYVSHVMPAVHVGNRARKGCICWFTARPSTQSPINSCQPFTCRVCCSPGRIRRLKAGEGWCRCAHMRHTLSEHQKMYPCLHSSS
jgi:hypothetical protein